MPTSWPGTTAEFQFAECALSWLSHCPDTSHTAHSALTGGVVDMSTLRPPWVNAAPHPPGSLRERGDLPTSGEASSATPRVAGRRISVMN
jgi:hypothetical protein